MCVWKKECVCVSVGKRVYVCTGFLSFPWAHGDSVKAEEEALLKAAWLSELGPRGTPSPPLLRCVPPGRPSWERGVCFLNPPV